MWSSFHFQGLQRSPTVGRENRALWLKAGRGGHRKREAVGVEILCLWSQEDSTAERSRGVTLELGSGKLTWTEWSCFWEPSPPSAPGLWILRSSLGSVLCGRSSGRKWALSLESKQVVWLQPAGNELHPGEPILSL